MSREEGVYCFIFVFDYLLQVNSIDIFYSKFCFIKIVGLYRKIYKIYFFFRFNLFFFVGLKIDIVFDLRFQMTKQGNKFNFDGSIIIYCFIKKVINEVVVVVKGIMMVNDVSSGLKVGVS